MLPYDSSLLLLQYYGPTLLFAFISPGQPNSSQPGTSWSSSPSSASPWASCSRSSASSWRTCLPSSAYHGQHVCHRHLQHWWKSKSRISESKRASWLSAAKKENRCFYSMCSQQQQQEDQHLSTTFIISAPGQKLFQPQVSKLNEVELVCEMDSVVIFKESSNHLFKISPLLGYRCIFIYSQKWGKGWKFQKLSRQGGGKVKVEYCIYVKILALQKDICSLKLDIANPYSSKDICCQSWMIKNCILRVCATELCQQLGSVSTLVWIDFKMERYVRSLRDLFDFSPL